MGKVEVEVPVNLPLWECYSAWSKGNFFQELLKNLKPYSLGLDDISRWTIEGTMGVTLVWYAMTGTEAIASGFPSPVADIHQDVNAQNGKTPVGINHSGMISFEPLRGNRTHVNVRVELEDVTESPAEFAAAKPLSVLEQAICQTLRNFKTAVEYRPFPSGSVQFMDGLVQEG